MQPDVPFGTHIKEGGGGGGYVVGPSYGHKIMMSVRFLSERLSLCHTGFRTNV